MLGTVVARHEALRTHLRADDDALVQVVRAPEPVSLSVVDLSDCGGPPRSATSAVLELAEQLARDADPAGPAAAVAGQAGPHRRPSGSCCCSWRTTRCSTATRSRCFLGEVTELAAAALADREPVLPALDIQYAGLRGVAARPARRRRAGAPARLLARPAGRRARGDRPADRPAPARRGWASPATRCGSTCPPGCSTGSASWAGNTRRPRRWCCSPRTRRCCRGCPAPATWWSACPPPAVTCPSWRR